MIPFTNNIKNAINSGVLTVETLIKIGSTRFETTAPVNLTLSNGETYIKHSTLSNTTPPQLDSALDSSEYTIQFSDSAMEEGATADILQNKDVEVRYIFYDATTESYLTNTADTILIYKGKVNSATYSIETDEVGESAFKVICGSPVSNLEMIKAFRSSKSFIRENVRADDTCFDQIYEGSGVINLKWGKK
jgi:hypothetical protein